MTLKDELKLWGGLTGEEWETAYRMAGLKVPETMKEFFETPHPYGWRMAEHVFRRAGIVPVTPPMHYEFAEDGTLSKLVMG